MIEVIIQKLEEYSLAILQYSPKLLLALIVFFVGLFIIKIISRIFKKTLSIKKIDPSLSHFFDSLLKISLKIILLLIVISILGIQTTSFVAILAAAGFAIGLALQGSLSNFAGGVLILLFKPFKVGDFIEVLGHAGKVSKIDILNTILKTGDNKTIILPNGSVSNSDIINYSIEKTRRVDLIVSIGYDDDIKKAKKILEKLVLEDNRILKDPNFLISINSLGASSIDINLRVWVEAANYWAVHSSLQEQIKATFDKKGISIPYPQRDIHIYKH